jgi:hypothetical protein
MNVNFDYGNILTRAFKLTWKHKSYWLFMTFPILTGSVIFLAFIAPVFFLEGNEDWMGLIIALWLGVIGLGMIVSLIVSTAGMTSLTLGILRAERGEGSTSFMDLVRDGFQYFARSFGVMLIVQLTVGAVFTAFFLCVMALTVVTMGLASICLQPVMLLLTPLSFLVAAVMNGGIVSVIEEDLDALDAVKRALQVVREHVWKFVIITLIVYFGASFLSGIFLAPAMIPAMFAPVAMEMGEQAFWAAMGSFVCLFFPAMGIYSGIIGAFTTSAIDIAYLQLSRLVEKQIIAAEDITA